MAGRGHAVRIVTTDAGLAAKDRQISSGIAGMPGPLVEAFPRGWPFSFGVSWPLRRRLIEVIPDCDVVHLHSLYLFHDWAAGSLCRHFGKPYIVRPHGTLDPYIRRRSRLRKAIIDLAFQDAVLEHAAGLHYTTREEWELARPAARNPRGAIVANGVDLDEFASLPPPSALRARYPAIGERKVVLFLGRLHEKKGLDVVIGAFALVARGRDDLALVLAGPDDGMRPRAEAWIAAQGIADRVFFTGMVTGEEKRIVYGGSDVFLLPSLSENFGITVIEAAACGIPVVVSDRVNLWHAFDEAKAGLVGPPSVDAFAAHLRFLLDHPAEASALGRRGAEFVRRNYGWDALGDAYDAMYAAAARDHALPLVN